MQNVQKSRLVLGLLKNEIGITQHRSCAEWCTIMDVKTPQLCTKFKTIKPYQDPLCKLDNISVHKDLSASQRM